MTERTIFECPAGKAWETDGELFRTYTIDDDAIFWSLVRAYDALQSRIAELEGENAKLTSYKDTLCGLLDELTDTEECRYDHHDNCQSHNLHERPCPHETAKALLKKEYEA